MRVTVLQGNGRSTKLEDRVNIIFQPESTKTSSVQGGEWRKNAQGVRAKTHLGPPKHFRHPFRHRRPEALSCGMASPPARAISNAIPSAASYDDDAQLGRLQIVCELPLAIGGFKPSR